MHSVTSNAVASALGGKADVNSGIWQTYFTPRQVNDPTWLANFVHSIFDTYGIGLILFSVGWEEYQSFSFAGAQGYIMRGLSSARAFGMMRNYDESRWTYSTRGIDAGFTSLSWTWISYV